MTSFYDRHVMPRLIACACAARPIARQRAKVVPFAEGRVLELGVGGGLNLAFYDPAKVSAVLGVDPSEALTWAFSRQGFRFNNSSIVSGRLFRYPGLSPFCDLVVSAPVQTHIRSALEAAAPLSRLRRAGAQEDETILCGGY
jgi:hypothetical protein